MNGWSGDADAHRRLGTAMAEHAIQAGADDASVLAQAANALLELDPSVERAKAVIDRATTLNPGSAYAWFIRGVVRLMEGRHEAAVQPFETAARLDPISRLGDMARAHIAVALALSGELAEAARLSRQTTFRTPRIHLALIAVYAELGMMDEARNELAHYEQSTATPIDEMVKSSSRDPDVVARLVGAISKVRLGV